MSLEIGRDREEDAVFVGLGNGLSFHCSFSALVSQVFLFHFCARTYGVLLTYMYAHRGNTRHWLVGPDVCVSRLNREIVGRGRHFG